MHMAPGPHLTADLLSSYSSAALSNAEELLSEAALLLMHGHTARAYFLAVSSIEEAGKALQSHAGQKRNLTDPAVRAKLKASFENHSQKINYALGVWAMDGPDPRTAIQNAIELIIALQRGREPSMYTDLRAAPDRVQLPRDIVKDNHANDCVRLAEQCLANARKHVSEKEPADVTTAHDKLFTMKSRKFQEMLNTEDYWWYALSQFEIGQQDIAEITIKYDREYIQNSKIFRPE